MGRLRGRARWPQSGHGERAISSLHQRQAHASTDCSSSWARPAGSAGTTTASTSLPVPQYSWPLGVGSTRRTGRLPSAALTGPVIHCSSPLRALTARRLGADDARERDRRLAGLELVDRGLGVRGDAEGAAGRQARDVLADARRRVLEAGHAAEPGDLVQLIGEAGERAGEQAGGRQPRAEAGRQAGERGRGQRRQAGDVDRDAGGVQQRARHLQALQALGREPVRDDRDHGAAGLDAGAQRLDQQAGLLGGRGLRNGVDASFRANQAFGFESEGDDHRGRPRRRRSVQLARRVRVRRVRFAREWTDSWRNALPPERAHGHNRARDTYRSYSDAS